MRFLIFFSALLLCESVFGLPVESSSGGPGPQTVARNLGALPIMFTENRGQWDERALFRAEASGATLWITGEGVCYEFARSLSTGGNASQTTTSPRTGPVDPLRKDSFDRVEVLVLKAALIGANPNPRARGTDPIEYKCNYFYGNDPDAWRSNVPNYRAVMLENIYPGIDLTYYGNGSRVEYDFRVSAGADYSQIRIEYEGAAGVEIASDGAMVVTTAWGEIRELAPVVYQEVGGGRRPISAQYRLEDDRSFGFRLGPEFDSSLPVVIDPVMVYSTYLGGALNDGGRGIAVDSSGSVYVTGETFSADFPTENPYRPSRTGYINAFVSKFTPAGNELVYSTYFGGSGTDVASAVEVSASGEAYLTGSTSSTDFPLRKEFQGTYGGGSADAFVVRLKEGGDSIVYSTYLGGSGWDSADDIVLDISRGACVTGFTSSSDFPTRNPYQATNHGGYDAFVARVSVGGTALSFSTYLGGGGDDDGNSIAVDDDGAVYVTGKTSSSEFPMSHEYQGWHQGWYIDAFITKLFVSGDSLVFSTYLGGDADDYGYGIAVDSQGGTYVTGRTLSANFPIANAIQETNQGGYDVFVTKLTGQGNSLVYSTYLGGAADDYGYGLTVDVYGTASLTGRTFSTGFPLADAYQETYQGGISDAFITRISANGADLNFSTFLGGGGYDGGYAIAVDAAGDAYVVGYTDSDDFPTYLPFQSSLNPNGADAFVIKMTGISGSDQDSDGVSDASDNCPEIANAGQEDINGDGVGDACCCIGRVGDANGQGGDEPTIGDISVLIDAKFISGFCDGVVACMSEADVNLSGGVATDCGDISIGDISLLIDYLFITGSVLGLPACL